MNTDHSPAKLWRYADLAEFLHMSQSYVRQAVMKKKIPFYKIGTSVRFEPGTIRNWLDSNKRVVQ